MREVHLSEARPLLEVYVKRISERASLEIEHVGLLDAEWKGRCSKFLHSENHNIQTLELRIT